MVHLWEWLTLSQVSSGRNNKKEKIIIIIRKIIIITIIKEKKKDKVKNEVGKRRREGERLKERFLFFLSFLLFASFSDL